VRNDLLALAHTVLEKGRPEKRDSHWDTHGTPPKTASQKSNSLGTSKGAEYQPKSLPVPTSHAIGDGTAGHSEDNGTPLGTLAGQPPYPAALTALKSGCPQEVDYERWQRAIDDADAFLASWGGQAVALGWTARDLLGLADVPDKPGPNYQRLSRYDQMGLVWMLQGRRVFALPKTAR
jgi:hypothetical protein